MFNYFLASALINFLTSASLGLWFIYKKSPFKNYILYNFGIAFWSLFYVMWQASSEYTSALYYCYLLMTGASLIPTFFMDFIFEVSETGHSRLAKVVSKVNYLISFFFIYALFSGHLITHLEPAMMFQFWPKGGGVFLAFLAFFFLNVVLAHVLLYQKYQSTLTPRFKFIFFATTLAFLGGSTNYFLWLNIPIPPIGNILVSVYAVLMAYAIAKLDFFELKVAIPKTAATVVLVIFTFLGMFVLFSTFVTKPFVLFLGVCVVTCLALLYGDLARVWIQTTIEKKFLKGRYNFRSVLRNFADGFSKASSIEDVVGIIKTHFGQETEFLNVRVFFPEFYEQKHSYMDRFIEFSQKDSTISVPDTPALATMKTLDKVMTLKEKDRNLTDSLRGLEATASIPCFSSTGDLLCIVLLGKKLSEDPISMDDIDLFNAVRLLIPQVLDRIDQSRKSAEVTVAQHIQTDILPKSPAIEGLDLACFMQPADEVGGDYYDILNTPQHSWMFVGDVTGHGLASGLVMFMAQSIIASILETNPAISPKQLNFTANSILYKNLQRLSEQRPMTLASLCFNTSTRQLTVSGCHDNLLIYRHLTHTIEVIALDHFPLGIGFTDLVELRDFEEISVSLSSGDSVFIISDGITEAVANGDLEGEFYGEDRLKSVILAHALHSASEIKEAILADLTQFSSSVYHDDVTLVIAKVL